MGLGFGVIFGLHGDNGKENGNYHNGSYKVQVFRVLGFRVLRVSRVFRAVDFRV